MGDAKLLIIAVIITLAVGTLLPLVSSPFNSGQSNDISRYSGAFGTLVGGTSSQVVDPNSLNPVGNISQDVNCKAGGVLCCSLNIGCQPVYVGTYYNGTAWVNPNSTVVSTSFFGAFVIFANPLVWVGGSGQDYVAQSISAWNMIPELISIPVVIVLQLLLVIGIYKAIDPFN